ncbi:MAG: amidohydrolase [Alphaproteobacteria bacterium]|nr:amidohydrolase [Alphaproteobacteria bacterium]
MKLDIYNHVFPVKYFERMQDVIPNKGPIKRWLNIPMLYDIDARLRIMETFGEYQQILSNSMPPLEYIGGPDQTPELARLANDGMHALCRKWPDRFPSFIASLPMNNMPATMKEIDRACNELNAVGIQIFSHVNGKPLDEPEFYPLFERMTQLDKPIWLHPARAATFSDYPTEKKSKYEIWWTFGWPYETSAAMARIVFSKMFDTLPNLKIITHHLGAMVPYFEMRVGPGWDQLGTRTEDEDYGALLASMKKRPVDYFKMFYADTAVFGSASATRCGLDFFGTERAMFASDCPFDPEGGPMYIRETIKILNDLDITAKQREDLYINNARKLLKL